MPQTMFYGFTCSGCKNAERLGKMDIEPNAPPSKLQELLKGKGWKDGSQTCIRQECATITYVTLDKVILLGPVQITKDGVEFP
jgi:hypothetical protein